MAASIDPKWQKSHTSLHQR
jgi:hypothetical protein